MFANIFFLFLILLIVASAPETASALIFSDNPTQALGSSIILYVVLIALIITQNHWLPRNIKSNRLLFITNIALLIFFLLSYFIFGAQRSFQNPSLHPFNATILTIYSLLLYFGAIFTYHYSVCSNPPSTSHASSAVRFLVPFSLPFVFLVFLGDLFSLLPYENLKKAWALNHYPWTDTIIFSTLSLAALIGTMILLPPLLIYIWKCPPLPQTPLLQRLQDLSTRAHFKHAGFRTWTVMENAINAAIVGVVAPFRYVVFTPKLLNQLSPDSVEAILAHEIGHKHHKHLLIYPLILFGMLVSGWIFSSLVIINWPQDTDITSLLNHYSKWKLLEPLAIFVIFVLVCAIYFRLIFGYFSRLFERQADSYVFEVKIPPQHMINALDEIAHAAGGIHRHPNWHHNSIQERINFLKKAEVNPQLIAALHRRVRISLIIYIIILAIAIGLLASF